MAHKVESMAYAGQVPWHGLGVNVDHKQTPAQMMKASKTDWKVSKRQLHYPDTAGKLIPADGEFAIVRDTDDKLLTTVGATYMPVQNEEIFDFFKKFTTAGKMTMETAGSLSDGQYIWALARLGKDFKVGNGKGGDEVRPYLLIMSPHVHGKALIMQYTPIRVVCWNTLSMALGSDLKGKRGEGFKMAHSQKWDAKSGEAEIALNLAMVQTEEFKDCAQHLAKKKATKDTVDKYFLSILTNPGKKIEGTEESKKTPTLLPKFRAALERAPGATMPSAQGTWWGALNAVTYVIDHEVGKDRQTALRGAWVGNHQKTKLRALQLAIEGAK